MQSYVSPLRYPGGKSKLVHYLERLLEENNLVGRGYAEPYAGGAGLALSLLMRGSVSKVYLNDIDYPLYCLWRTVLEDTEALCRKVRNARITLNTWKQHKEKLSSPDKYSELDVGFAFLFLNRTNRSGIISGSAIGGLEQASKWKIDARFYKTTIIHRIRKIAAYKNRIFLYNYDAINFLQKIVAPMPDEDVFVYLDPPYYEKGKRLYQNHYEYKDHKQIATKVASLEHPWIVSYDNVSEIASLYRPFRRQIYSLNYSAAQHYRGKEMIIFSNQLKIPRQRITLSSKAINPGP